MNMEKKMIRTEILYSTKSKDPFTLGEILNIAKNNSVELQNGDEIRVQYSCDSGLYEFLVYRVRLETDEEAKAREEREEKIKNEDKVRRYETYLNLKREFENEKNSS